MDSTLLLEILEKLDMDEIEAFSVDYTNEGESYNFSYEKNLKV